MADLGAIGVQDTDTYSVSNRTWGDSTRKLVAGCQEALMQYAPAGLAGASSSVSGTVKENSIAAQRLVRVYRRDTGELLGSDTSDAAGVFSVPLNGFVGQVFVIAFDDTGVAPDFNAQIYDLVVPA